MNLDKIPKKEDVGEKIAKILENLTPSTWEQTIVNISLGKSDSELEEISNGYNSAVIKMGKQNEMELLNPDQIKRMIESKK